MYYNYLTHFVSGQNLEESYQKFLQILYEGQLKGSGNLIKGGHKCICFTECPISNFPFSEKLRYKKFGFVFNKTTIYGMGAEKVFYCKECDYYNLHTTLQWRYQAHNPPVIDFSWENEVRLPKESLNLKYDCKLLIPSRVWEERLQKDYDILTSKKYSNEQEEFCDNSCVVPIGLNFSILYYDEIN